MTKPTSFATDIRPLFTERDIHAMSKAFNLANYDEVKAHAAAIYDRIRGIGGAVMPPPPPKGGRSVAAIAYRTIPEMVDGWLPTLDGLNLSGRHALRQFSLLIREKNEKTCQYCCGAAERGQG
jgi:hypothetical protein